MITNFFKRLHSEQRKWYIQPLDPGSSSRLYLLLKGAKTFDPKMTTGCPRAVSDRLIETDRKTIKTLMEETSIGALTAEGTDYGINFFVYFKEKDEEKPRYCFASTSAMRRENGSKHKERPLLGSLALTVYRSEKPPKEKTAIAIQKEEPIKIQPVEKISPIRFKRPSKYRISTHHKKAFQLLSDELQKAGEPTEPIPNIREGMDEVWDVPSSSVLAMKILASRQLLYFRIWEKDEKGAYRMIGKYPKEI
jgi:hypothetical protein